MRDAAGSTRRIAVTLRPQGVDPTRCDGTRELHPSPFFVNTMRHNDLRRVKRPVVALGLL